MALIKCPECGKEVSDKSPQCIHCGYPFETTIAIEITSKTQNVSPKYNVLLVGCSDERKLDTIKVVRELTNLGLKEAKELVESCPKRIAENITHDEYLTIQQTFSNVGAWIQCEEIGNNLTSNTSVSPPHSSNSGYLKNCPTCNKSISIHASNCPHCGHSFVKQQQKSGITFWGVVGAIIVAILIIMYL